MIMPLQWPIPPLAATKPMSRPVKLYSYYIYLLAEFWSRSGEKLAALDFVRQAKVEH
jgi:hypothetical protein